MSRSVVKICLLLMLQILLAAAQSNAQYNSEQILSYVSEINVNEDAELLISETIQVYAAGDQIKRGIYRDFPIIYRDRGRHKYKVGFDIISVKRDNRDEEYRLESFSNGVRIYIGNKNIYLNPGVYTYTLTFRTNRQLGFFKDHDELYFNAIGTGWIFPIKHAEVYVNLPQSIPHQLINFDGYSGPFGATYKDFKASLNDDYNSVHFKLSRPLLQHEGLTVVVSWPKGFIKEPSQLQRWKYFISDNRDILIGGLGLLFTFLYYFIAWWTSGRDPDKGPIFPQWEIPNNLSAAETRYLNKMHFDQKALAVALLEMAVKGSIKIVDKGSSSLFGGGSKYELEATGAVDNLRTEELAIYNTLFPGGRQIFQLDNDNYREVRDAQEFLKEAYQAKHLKRSFYSNGELVLPGIFMMLLTGFLEFFSLSFSSALLNFGNVVIFSLFIVMHLFFKYLLKAPTFAGRRLMDKIEGLKMYMGTAERENLQRALVPEDTPQLFEKFLPYAVALGVQSQWSERFASVFSRLGAGGNEYHPRWYSGRLDAFNTGSFGSDFSKSFSNSIAASSSPPGTSSGMSGGFSGGGSSGGGGGGGGGGGW